MAPNMPPTHHQLEQARQHLTEALKTLDTTPDTPNITETLLRETHREANHWHTVANRLQHDNTILHHIINRLTHKLDAVGAHTDITQYTAHLTTNTGEPR